MRCDRELRAAAAFAPSSYAPGCTALHAPGGVLEAGTVRGTTQEMNAAICVRVRTLLLLRLLLSRGMEASRLDVSSTAPSAVPLFRVMAISTCSHPVSIRHRN